MMSQRKKQMLQPEDHDYPLFKRWEKPNFWWKKLKKHEERHEVATHFHKLYNIQVWGMIMETTLVNNHNSTSIAEPRPEKKVHN